MIDYSAFEKLDFRVGTILKAKAFPKAKKPAYQLEIDFGPLGVLRSSAQITKRYKPEDLSGRQIIGIVNIGTRKIADFESQCLILGATENEDVILLAPESKIPNGQQVL
ncbi:MAG: tRNA-binding protein [Flavobacteriaceae bacterium]